MLVRPVHAEGHVPDLQGGSGPDPAKVAAVQARAVDDAHSAHAYEGRECRLAGRDSRGLHGAGEGGKEGEKGRGLAGDSEGDGHSGRVRQYD